MSPTRRRWPYVLLALCLIWFASAFWQAGKPLPPGVGVAMPWRSVEKVDFLADLTYVDAAGTRYSEQEIFDTAFEMIRRSRKLVVLDMFLFNDFAAAPDAALRPLSSELTQALLHRMRAVPGLRVVVISDPINTVYGGTASTHLEVLERAGAQVVLTDLSALRASNPLWSGPWALCCGWLGNNAAGGWLPNPFGTEKITLRSWLALPNFRANHRKTLVVDAGESWQALVTSANPHDASAAHGNVALRFSGAAALDVLHTEAAVAAFSDKPLTAFPAADDIRVETGPRLRVLTEGAIGRALMDTVEAAASGETLDVAVFYLSHRGLIHALKAAHARGVTVRVLLDPNEDAFGRKKNGVPNRQVAHELSAAGIPLRWCDTHGEQCHAKVLLHRGAQEATLIAGSANFTRRNLDDLNLETSVQLRASEDHPAITDAAQWFETNWANEPSRRFSTDYATYADTALLRRAWYRIGEAAGLSTW